MSRIITVPFTENFLPHVVDYAYRFYTSHNEDLSRLCLVFGGRRPALFIKRDLAARIRRPFAPPRFFTIDEWMAYVAYGDDPPPQGSDLDHCYAIYRLAMEVCPWVCRGRESFVEFLPWAREILHFTEQLDLEDVPADSLNSIREHATIGFSVPEDINKLLMHLGALRQAYHQELERRQWAPRGYRYAQAARRVGELDLKAFDEILFCNFFYLHRTEKTVIKNIYDRGHAVLFMQGDQRRWPALSRIADTFGTPILEGAEVTPTQFNLNIYEAFDSHAQAGLVSGILEGIREHESTVIVLPDADFLPVLLTVAGERLKEFNVSMGHPLRRSGLYTLLTFCLQAQRRRKGNLYYARDYLAILRHPLVMALDWDTDKRLPGLLAAKIEEALKGELLTETSGRLFLDPQDITSDGKMMEAVIKSAGALGLEASAVGLEKMVHGLHQAFLGRFENIRTALDLSEALHSFVGFMQERGSGGKFAFNDQMAQRLQEAADEWGACSFAHEMFEPGDLFKVLEERLSSQMVAFGGSPLRGLQILGLFETRALNFKNVIVVDVNEGLLPSLNIYEPLIPREVMIKLNLDRLELEEEIQRYGFMRLISAAQEVHLIYRQNGEKTRSRFLEELIWEKERHRCAIGSVGIVRGAFEASVDRKQRVIPKTAAMVDFLKSFSFSATSLNAYLQNPYHFYCRYILGLKDREDLLEDLESRHIGTFVHDLLQEAFAGFSGKKPVLDARFREYFRKICRSRFAATFGKVGRSDAFLMETVLKTRLERFLDQETSRCQAAVNQLLYVERKWEDTVPLACGQVRLACRIDRADEMTDTSIMVLDYKTGGADIKPKPPDPDFPLSREYIRDHVKSFQMPLYLHCLRKQFPGRKVNCALYNLRTMAIEKFLTPEQMEEVEGILEGYWKALDFIISEIYNSEIPFIDDPVDIR